MLKERREKAILKLLRLARRFLLVLIVVLVVVPPFLTFSAQAENTIAYYPSSYNLLGSTRHISGSLGDLQSDNGIYMTFRSYATATSGQTLYAHNETTTIGGVSYYLHKLSPADGNGTTLTASAATTGRKLMGRWFYPLSGIVSIPASMWTVTYRAMRSASAKSVVAHGDVDILIRKSDGTVRSTIATDVANSPSLTLTNAWETLTGTYYWPGYTVVDQTDYLDVAYYIEVTTSQASKKVSLMVDDGTLALADQTKIAKVMLPSEYTMEVEFTGTSNIEDWTQLVWTIDSAWTTASVSVTLQLYNYQTGQYPTSGNGHISYTSSGTADTDETKKQTITSNPTYFRDAGGNWKIKVKGVKSTTTQFDFKADLVEYKTITYVAQAPIASFTYSPADPCIYDIITFNASASYDPDGYIVSYKWDFGDENITTVTNPIITHIYTTGNSTITYTINLTVTDNEGLTNSTTDTVSVINPTILHVSLPAGTYFGPNPDDWLSQCWRLNITSLSGTFTIRINNTHASWTSYDTHLIIALNNASYEYLDNLTVETTTISKTSFIYGTPEPYGFTLTWEEDVYPTWFSDVYVVGTVDPKSYKDVQVSVTFSNTTGVRMHFDAYGSRDSPPPPTGKGHVTHNSHQKDSTVLFWPPVNNPPVAYDQSVTTDEDTPKAITLTASDPEDDPLTYFIVTGPSHGSLSGSPPSVTYTPHSDYNGPDSFTFKAYDGQAYSNVATVFITVNPVNDPPTAPVVDVTPDSPLTTDDLVCTVTTPSIDPDGDTVTYTYEWYKDGDLQSGLTTVTTELSVTIDSSNTAEGEVWRCVVTPNDGVEDGSTDQDEVTIGTIPNSPPVLDTIGDKSVDEETLLSFTATATDPDVPPQTLTFSLGPGAPSGASITSGGDFTWTPTEVQGPGSYAIRIIVSDGIDQDFEDITVTVNEVNLPPVLDPIGDKTVAEGALLQFTVTASDPDIPAQTLTYSASNLPSGATFNPNTRVFSWTPTSGQAEVYSSVHFEVSDGYLEDSEDITITATAPTPPPPPPPCVGGEMILVKVDKYVSQPPIDLVCLLLAAMGIVIILMSQWKKGRQ